MHGQIRLLLTLWSASLFLLLAASTPARAENGDCGIPHTFGSDPKSSDCLFILRAGVDIEDCLDCICDTDGNGDIVATDAQLCLRSAVGQPVTLHCPACEVSGGCPASVAWVTEAKFGAACINNTDCGGAVCDQATDRCTSATTLDFGWTGSGHGTDLNNGSTLLVDVECSAADAPCGVCEIQGVNTSAGACRCDNDTQKWCDEAFEQDENDCPACEGGAFVGDACASNTDCTSGTCTRRCSDTRVPCENPGDCTTGTCEEQTQCTNGKACLLEGDCAGTCTQSSQCRCFEGPPVPLIAGNLSICMLQRLTADVSGTVNVDTGAATLVKPLQFLIHLGFNDTAPCPICGGTCSNNAERPCVFDSDCEGGGTCELDDVIGDGVRQGTCIGGDNDGAACDVEAINTSYPAGSGDAGGGGTSLDCMPNTSAVGSGPAQSLEITLTTDGNTLTSALSCGGENEELSCPCLVCSSNFGVACTSNADCAAEPGVCTLSSSVTCDSNADCTGIDAGACLGNSRCEDAPAAECNNDNDCDSVNVGSCIPAECSSSGEEADFPLPNQCADGLCSDAGGGEALCTTGPDDSFCDFVLSGDGSGAVPCTNNNDCIANSEGGTCTLLERRSCFQGTIEADGDVDSRHPILAAAFCMGPTPVEAINDSFGLPGPIRLVNQSTLRSFCATAPTTVYRPGTGNCPD